jgi:hypothetical protein
MINNRREGEKREKRGRRGRRGRGGEQPTLCDT